MRGEAQGRGHEDRLTRFLQTCHKEPSPLTGLPILEPMWGEDAAVTRPGLPCALAGKAPCRAAQGRIKQRLDNEP